MKTILFVLIAILSADAWYMSTVDRFDWSETQNNVVLVGHLFFALFLVMILSAMASEAMATKHPGRKGINTMTDYFRIRKQTTDGSFVATDTEIVSADDMRELGELVQTFEPIAPDILTLDEAVSVLVANDPLLRTDIANHQIRVAMKAAKTGDATAALLAWTFDIELGLCETCNRLTCWHEELPGVWLCKADYLAENPEPEAVTN